MTEFTAISYAMLLCTEREAQLRRQATTGSANKATRATLLELAEEASAVRSRLREIRSQSETTKQNDPL